MTCALCGQDSTNGTRLCDKCGPAQQVEIICVICDGLIYRGLPTGEPFLATDHVHDGRARFKSRWVSCGLVTAWSALDVEVKP